MERCECDDNNVKPFSKKKTYNNSVPLLRQIFVTTGVWSLYFALGLCFGAPTVLIPQLRRETYTTNNVSDEMASWLLSVHGYGALPWVFIIPLLTNYIGRKKPFIIVNFTTFIGFLVFYSSSNAMIILISELIQGFLLASNITLLVMIVTEYTDPKYRGIFLTVKSTIFFQGVWVANVTGTFFYWKNIGLIGLACVIYSATCVLWPESPYWLASRGKFKECTKAFHWIRGDDFESKKELENLIDSYRVRKDLVNNGNKITFNRFLRTVSNKAFYKPVLISMSLTSLYHFSGKFVCIMYSLDLVKQITNSETAAYIGMIVMEGITILGMLFGCFLSKILSRRALLLGSSIVAIVLLFVISLYLYLNNVSIIEENKYVSLSLLAFFSLAISCGPMILAEPVFGEVTCLSFKSSSLLAVTLYSEFLTATVLKLAPFIFKTLKLHGAFLFFGISASLFTFLLYMYLPETNGKTLQEIERYFLDSEPSEAVHNIIHETDDGDD